MEWVKLWYKINLKSLISVLRPEGIGTWKSNIMIWKNGWRLLCFLYAAGLFVRLHMYEQNYYYYYTMKRRKLGTRLLPSWVFFHSPNLHVIHSYINPILQIYCTNSDRTVREKLNNTKIYSSCINIDMIYFLVVLSSCCFEWCIFLVWRVKLIMRWRHDDFLFKYHYYTL